MRPIVELWPLVCARPCARPPVVCVSRRALTSGVSECRLGIESDAFPPGDRVNPFRLSSRVRRGAPQRTRVVRTYANATEHGRSAPRRTQWDGPETDRFARRGALALGLAGNRRFLVWIGWPGRSQEAHIEGVVQSGAILMAGDAPKRKVHLELGQKTNSN